MKTRFLINIITGFLLFFIGFVIGCGDERPIPGKKILTIYNSNMEETKRLAPLDTMYVKVSALSPGKYYEISVNDSDGKLISKIESMTDEDGVIGPAPLWYDVGLRNKNGVPAVELPDDVDIMPFKVKVKSIEDKDTDFNQEMWIVYENDDVEKNPKPIVYAGYKSGGEFYFSNAFDETGTKKEDGITDSDKTRIFVKAEMVPGKVHGSIVDKVDFYIIPFIGGILQDGYNLVENAVVEPKEASVTKSHRVDDTLLWDLNAPETTLVNPGQDNMAYTIVMDVDRNGIYDAGIDTDSDGLIDSYIDGVDGLDAAGFIVMNTPANDVFVTVKDGSGKITGAIPEKGNDDLYINIDNLAVAPSKKVNIYLIAPDGTNLGPVSADVKPASKADGKYLPYVEKTLLISNHDMNAIIQAPDVTKDTRYDIFVDVDNDGNIDAESGDIFLEDYISVLFVKDLPEYKTYSDPDALNESQFFDETNTENGKTIVYLKAENQSEDYKAYVLKDKEWVDGERIRGAVLSKTGSGEEVLKLWDLNSEYKVINPKADDNIFDIVVDNNNNGNYDESVDDILSIVILNTEANTYPRVSYVNIASGAVFGNIRAQHWTRYSEYCDYRDVFQVNGTDTNRRGGYGVKAVFNPYFKWFGQAAEIPVEGLYHSRYVDVYIVDKKNFDLSKFGHANELNDEVDVRKRHSTLSVQPSCFNGAGIRTIWRIPLVEGEYYVIVDVNRNGRIDEGIDIIDAVNRQNETILDNPDIVGFSVE